jgi:hypothetical protein
MIIKEKMVCLGKIGFIALGDSCGKSPSKSIKVNVNSTSITNLNQSLKSIQSQETNTALNQVQDVVIKGACCQPLEISQKLKAVVVDESKMSVTFKTQMAKNLSNDISSMMKGVEDNINGLLKSDKGTQLKAAVDMTLTKMNSENKIANIISEKVSKTVASQGQKIYIDCGSGDIPTPPAPSSENMPDTGCYISQNFVFEQVTNNVMEAVFNTISNDSNVKNILAGISREMEETQKEENVEVKVSIDTFLGINKVLAGLIGGFLIFVLIVVILLS